MATAAAAAATAGAAVVVAVAAATAATVDDFEKVLKFLCLCGGKMRDDFGDQFLNRKIVRKKSFCTVGVRSFGREICFRNRYGKRPRSFADSA